MKKIITSVTAAVIALLMTVLTACGKGITNEVGEETTDATTTVEETTDEEVITTIEQLREKAGDVYVDSWGGYSCILAFLTGDTETLALHGQADIPASEYESISEIKVDSFSIVEKESKNLDFRFSVSESDCEIFPVGDYHYTVWLTWIPENKYDGNEEYSDLIRLIKWAAVYGCLAWENGTATKERSSEFTFDYGVWSAVTFARALYSEKGNDLPGADFDRAVKLMFGIDNYVSTSPYLEFSDGEWNQVSYVGALNSVITVEDIREIGDGKLEIDIQYFADILSMIPSYKSTWYVSETGDEIYRYCFEKAVITEQSEYEPYFWGN